MAFCVQEGDHVFSHFAIFLRFAEAEEVEGLFGWGHEFCGVGEEGGCYCVWEEEMVG